MVFSVSLSLSELEVLPESDELLEEDDELLDDCADCAEDFLLVS